MDEDEEDVQDDGEPGPVWVGPVFEGEEVLFALGVDSRAEAEGGDADCDPGELVGYTDDTGGEGGWLVF